MDFQLTEEQRALADTVGRFIERDYGFEARWSVLRSPEGWSRRHWQTLAELGLTGLPLAHVKLTLACWAFMLAAHHMPGVAFLGTLAPVQQLSAAAYAIYLMHQPILGYMGEMMGKRFEPLTAFVILCVVGWPLSRWAARKLDRAAEKVAG